MDLKRILPGGLAFISLFALMAIRPQFFLKPYLSFPGPVRYTFGGHT